MSEMQEFSDFRNEENGAQENRDPTAVLAQDGKAVATSPSVYEMEGSIDGQSYTLGEVPQSYLVDPKVCLPLNSDHLNVLENLTVEVNQLIQQEVEKIQVLQKKISFWEDRIEKNKGQINSNMGKIKQNVIDISYDKKNRDYWWVRSEAVMVDYSNAEAANRCEDWEWLIKKYGLKCAGGGQILPDDSAVEELCNGEASNLAGEYKYTGNKYEQARKDREAENNRLIRENSRMKASTETLQSYISTTYSKDIEPLQDGVLLLKELGVKFKALGQDSAKISYGDLRAWAEPFLDEFLRSNPRVPQAVVTDFRKLASIPLPAENC